MEVVIKELTPVRQMTFQAFGTEPEDKAWKKLEQWVKQRNFPMGENTPIYGFNNPNPSAGSEEYGYEFRLTLPSEYEPQKGDEPVEFPGGKYASTKIEVKTGEEIPKAWAELMDWFESSPYSQGSHQWLEGASPRGLPVELFLPIQ